MTETTTPGYRRRIAITPAAGTVTAALEDDFHCMAVRLDHDGAAITAVHPQTERAPWTTCPDARDTLIATFTGLPLDAAAAPREKRHNCTHLYDLAVLAAAHARDPAPFVYEVSVSDPDEGETTTQVHANGHLVHRWQIRDMALTAPPEIASLPLTKLRDWIATLPPPQAEAARVLQWASMVAHGRQMTNWPSFTGDQMPANCYAFQPERAAQAIRVGPRYDFSTGPGAPLDHFDGQSFAQDRAPPPSY